MPITLPPVDARDEIALLEQFQTRLRGYLPSWNPPPLSTGAAVGPILSRMIGAIIQRLNHAPLKQKLAMLDLLGLRLIPAQPARAPIVFSLTQGASDTSAPKGTQVAAPPPVGSTQQVVFSTEGDCGVTAATLAQIVSLWPGRDQYIDHSADLLKGDSFTLFQNLKLQQTEHILYLAHGRYLAFAGIASLKVIFDLAQPGSAPLQIAWEYWDGQVWRGFFSNQSPCFGELDNELDGTAGLTDSGSVLLSAEGAQTAEVTVNGVSSYWLRARVTQPLLPDPNRILPEIETIRLVSVIQQPFEAILACSISAPTISRIFLRDSLGNVLPATPVKVVLNGKTVIDTVFTDSAGTVIVSQPFAAQQAYDFKIGTQEVTATHTVASQYTNIQITVAGATAAAADAIALCLTNGAGTGLPNARLTFADANSSVLPLEFDTDANGNVILGAGQNLTPGHTYTFVTTWAKQQATATALYTGTPVFEVDLSLSLRALRVDKAFSEGKALDVSKAFQPFGAAPQVGAAFYFKQQEAFSKPGANVRIFANAITSDPIPTTGSQFTHIVVWEYWNGYEWVSLLDPSANYDFSQPQVIEFIVPEDMVPTKVNNQDGLWVRVRIAGGRFGYLQTITIQNATPPTVSFPVIQPPVLADFRVSYSWQNGPFPLEHVFTLNDFQYEDRTSNAHWPGNPFPPYQLVADVTPSLYLGFSAQLPVNNFGMYVDLVERAGLLSGPEMIWEYWNGVGWTSIPSEDETRNLALRGMITFIPAADALPLARFGAPLYWIRGRLKEDGTPNQTTVSKLYTNAVWASQWQSYSNSPLGVSTGVPRQIFRFNQIPILPGQTIEIQELSGPRANTEWRSIAMQVSNDPEKIVLELEELLGAEGSQTDIVKGDIHLVRDKTKKVTAVWIQWNEVQNFFESTSSDRVYVLDHALGRLFFGDGVSGSIPPLGAQIQATSFVSGGGLAGNVARSTITQLLGSVPGIQSVNNPHAAEGGADGETLEQFQQRAPVTFRNRDRAIVPADYAALAEEASAGVAIARAFPARDSSGIARPGWITVMIIPQSTDPRPTPSAGLRQQVLKYLLARAPADIAGSGSINVVGPDYVPVDVSSVLAPVDPDEAGTIEKLVSDALSAFLNPLTGGPEGLGWDTGRSLYVSDIARVLGQVTGVDYVEKLNLFVNGVLQGDQVRVAVGQIVVAGQFTISLLIPVGV